MYVWTPLARRVLDDTLATPPGAPAFGDSYIVPTGGLGAWAGLDGALVEWTGATWFVVVPVIPIGYGIVTKAGCTGSFAGHDCHYATVTNIWAGSYTYTFQIPIVSQPAVYVRGGYPVPIYFTGTAWETAPAGGGGGILTAFFRPFGCSDVDDAVCTLLGITPSTIEISEEARATYLGMAPSVFTSVRVGVDVMTAAAGTDWCEVALLKGTPVLFDGPASLTLLGYADASADWSVPGPVATTIAPVSIAPGDHLWLAWSVKQGGGTLPAFRATLPDAILAGFFVFTPGLRLSTMPAGTNFNRCGSAVRGARAGVGCS